MINSKLDHVIEGANAGVDEVRASNDFVLASNVEDLRLMDGAVSGAANDLANVISGHDAYDVLKAMGGDDMVYGGAGNDAIDGGIAHERLYRVIGNDIIHGVDGEDFAFGGGRH